MSRTFDETALRNPPPLPALRRPAIRLSLKDKAVAKDVVITQSGGFSYSHFTQPRFQASSLFPRSEQLRLNEELEEVAFGRANSRFSATDLRPPAPTVRGGRYSTDAGSNPGRKSQTFPRPQPLPQVRS
jgi:hypothetical protein